MLIKDRQENMPQGVSGLMRVKDDAQFIERCVKSCIDALDELIIVYNDCSDESPAVIENVRRKYPDKIRVFPYEHHILSLNLTKEEYEFAKSLPNDDPRLLCNYYNFALSKARYQYAVKIDADQMYFTSKLTEWCDFFRKSDFRVSFGLLFLGFCTCLWVKCVNKLCIKTKRMWHLIPSSMPKYLKRAYYAYAQYRVKKYGDCIILSGMNLVDINGKWMVPKGRKHPVINILPPFNGAGDHLFFKVTRECYYEPLDSLEYAKLLSGKYALIERFVCPRKRFVGGYFWFHLNMERPSIKQKILTVYAEKPDFFEPVEDVLAKSFYDLNEEISKDMYAVPTRAFSHFTYAYSSADLKKYFKEMYGGEYEP